MSEFKCTECPYYWRDVGDNFPCCHFDGLNFAPCELEEYDNYL